MFYTRVPNKPNLEVVFTVAPVKSMTTSVGWRKTFLLTDKEEIILRLGLEQGWDEVEWKSYSIVSALTESEEKLAKQKKASKKAVTKTLPVSFKEMYGMGQGYHLSHYGEYESSYHKAPFPGHSIETSETPEWEEELQPKPKLQSIPMYPNSPTYLSVFDESDKKYAFTLYYTPDPVTYTLVAWYNGKQYNGKVSGYTAYLTNDLLLTKNKMIQMIKADFPGA